jgi:hypothetical protein
MSSMGAVFAGVVHGLLVSLALGWLGCLARWGEQRTGRRRRRFIDAGRDGNLTLSWVRHDQSQACDRLGQGGLQPFSPFLLLQSDDSASC